MAKKKGVSMAQIALAWCMAKPGVSAPIVGTTSLDKLKDLLGELLCSLCAEYNRLIAWTGLRRT